MTTDTRPAAIIDGDPGHDDVMAILLGGRLLDLRGITTVHGNAALRDTTENARKTVEFSGLTDVPIAAGADRPLVREAHHAPEVHGITGLDGPDLPPPTVALHELDAADFLIARSHDVPDLHLLPIGPLTNIATALARDPSLPERIARISLMGGSLTWGNVTPAAEFNIWCDPEAADIVFRSGIPITMVGLNVTMQVLATPERRADIRRIGRRSAGLVADMLDHYSIGEAIYTGLPGGAMHDPLAVVALVRPDLIRTVPLQVSVEVTGDQTAGMTLCDGRGLGPDLHPQPGRPRGDGAPPNADVAVAVDVDGFWSLFLEILATYP